ncbi:hypothetical protein [Microbacterium oleivorans]|uniref:hypothetical protein n=1 Tax=Microbacterium oleivorans TaxID=273677 RepID=UPI00080E96AE|nr:hypothetical protein [Microbacterium oleivorans]
MRNAGPPGSSGEGRTEVLRIPAFRLFWTATTIRGFGSAIANVAFQVLIVTVVAATPAQIGILNAILVGRSLTVVPWLLLAVVPLSSATTITVLLVIVSIAQFLFGLAMGIEDANDISYRQAIAPDAIQGRMNATIRTTNRIVFFFGALGAGVLATWLGYAASLGVAAAVFAVAALVIVF